MMRKLLFAAITLLSFTVLHRADALAEPVNPSEYPLFAPERITIGARTEYAWWTGKDELQLPDTPKEFGVGLVGSYALVPKLSATLRAVYFVDSRITQYAVGLNFKIYEGLK